MKICNLKDIAYLEQQIIYAFRHHCSVMLGHQLIASILPSDITIREWVRRKCKREGEREERST
jgi:hypothetical protein